MHHTILSATNPADPAFRASLEAVGNRFHAVLYSTLMHHTVSRLPFETYEQAERIFRHLCHLHGLTDVVEV